MVDEDTFVVPVEEYPVEDKPAPAGAGASPQRPAVTFMGNTYDLVALGALASGLLVGFLCLTLNYGIYFLPFLPLILGLIGVFTARQAVDEQRAKTYSWIALGIAGGILLLAVLCIFLAIVFYALMFLMVIAIEAN